jgi:hypothetical protein
MDEMIDKHDHHKQTVQAYNKGNPEDRYPQIGQNFSTLIQSDPMSECIESQSPENDKSRETENKIQNKAPDSSAFMIKKLDRYVALGCSDIGQSKGHRNNSESPDKVISSGDADIKYSENDIQNCNPHHQQDGYTRNVGKEYDKTFNE